MNRHTIKTGLTALAKVDKEIAQAVKLIGLPEPRNRPAGFETFLSTIVSQQISTKAAQAIKGRVVALVPQMSAEALLEIDDEALRGAGLSYRKIEYAKGLAKAIHEGQLNVDGLNDMSDNEAIETITALKGFGRWSAEIYLMFSLKREDIFPADDLALLVALGKLKGLEKKPTPKVARDMTEHWAPWRSVGSLFLWHYYQGVPT